MSRILSNPRRAGSTQGGPEQAKATPQKTSTVEKDSAKRYEISPRELEAVSAFFAKEKKAPSGPRMKVSEKDGVTQVEFDHPEPLVAQILLTQALGANDFDFFNGILDQLENATTGDRVNGRCRQLNFMLSVIRGINPRDQVEAMIGAQMAVIHNAFMNCAHLLATTCVIDIDSGERALAKLGRTFATQVEALNRYRSTGERKPKQERVKLHADGGAQLAANERSKANGAGNGKASHAPQSAMRSPNPECPTVPVTSDAERPVPHARRHVNGGAQRK
jgi:hypothetical protein